MKIVSSITKINYDITLTKSGENVMPCPECTAQRKHKNRKSFSFNATSKVGFCQNCEAKFYEYKPYIEKKEYTLPVNKNRTSLTDAALKWFEGRGISQRTLNEMKVYSDTEFMPQINADASVICFPFFIDNKLANIKYRDGRKNFKLVKDAELIFYNINALKDAKEIIITEGEIDCLSFIESGIAYCISVPNGAGGNNLEYLDNHLGLFKDIERIYLATDNDIKGIELREELIRRFGMEKCAVVLFGDCKDANEYLHKYGRGALVETIKKAIDIPVDGIVDLNFFYDEIYSMFVTGLEGGKIIGIHAVDSVVTWELGRLAVITGIPGHGKSEFVDFMVTKLNILYGWKIAYFSPENYPIKYHYSKIAAKITGRNFKQGYISQELYEEVFNHISDNFFFIYPEDDMSFENIITKAKYLVRKHGIKVLVVDPYNKIEHLRDRNESETEYISRFLDRITTFAKQYGVLVILVAHPRKMEKGANGIYSMPNLYDINGSANFYNKCDYGISIYRDFVNVGVQVNVLKVKFRHLGEGGRASIKFNYFNGRYEPDDSTVDRWDNKSYLDDEHKPEQPKSHEYSLTEVIHYDNNNPPF